MTPGILAIESSCDETAVAVVSESGAILAESLSSQIETHRRFGGVVPEVASRAHFEALHELVQGTLARARDAGAQLKAVAATCGPGLVGPLLVGASYGEGFARGAGLPFIGVHHLRGHLASALLEDSFPDGAAPATLRERAERLFPALVLLVSGGHTQILEVDAQLRARKLADTADDAAGECFDKSAKLMGLPYPGGPEIERLAAKLDPADRAKADALLATLPIPRSAEGFSFSGLKTAIRLRLAASPELSATPVFAWAVQEAIARSLRRGLERSDATASDQVKSFILCGGVAANQRIRATTQAWAERHGWEARFPPLRLATDNAAMIAAAAWVQDESLRLREVTARLPLELATAENSGDPS